MFLFSLSPERIVSKSRAEKAREWKVFHFRVRKAANTETGFCFGACATIQSSNVWTFGTNYEGPTAAKLQRQHGEAAARETFKSSGISRVIDGGNRSLKKKKKQIQP